MALPFLFKPTALERLTKVAHGNEGYVHTEYPSSPRERSAMIAAAIEELRAAPPMQRAKLAKKANLPGICATLSAQADALLAFMIDDEVLSRALGDAAARIWLQQDSSGCIAHVMARADSILPSVLLLVLADARVDKTEAFEVLAPRYRDDGALRELLTRGYFPGAPSMRSTLSDPRFVDLALESLRDEPGSSCRLLGVHGSARAIDELRALLDGAASFDDDIARAALDGLELAFTQQQFIDLLVALLASSPLFSPLSPNEIAEGPLGFRLAVVHGYAFMHHPVVQQSARLQEIGEACVQAHPVVPAG